MDSNMWWAISWINCGRALWWHTASVGQDEFIATSHSMTEREYFCMENIDFTTTGWSTATCMVNLCCFDNSTMSNTSLYIYIYIYISRYFAVVFQFPLHLCNTCMGRANKCLTQLMKFYPCWKGLIFNPSFVGLYWRSIKLHFQLCFNIRVLETITILVRWR